MEGRCKPAASVDWKTAAVCLENLESALIHAVEEPSYASWYVEIALEWSAMVKKTILERLDSKH